MKLGHVLVRICLRLALVAGLVCGLWGLSGSDARAERKKTMVELKTSLGDIILELFPEQAPATVANFEKYVKDGFYDGTIFHRVIDGFMIQGGGMDAQMAEKPTRPPVANEADNGLKNTSYTIAMARTQDPHSATAQFFINVADNQFLNHTGKNPRGWGYAVFGKVVKGTEVVDKIKKVATTTRQRHENVPVEPVTIISARLVEG